MLFNNVSQVVVLGLLLLVGWLFGFASHPGGKKWKRAYRDEAVGRAQDRDELDAQLRDVDARVAALTQENAALNAALEQARQPRPSSPAPVAAAPVVAAAAAVPAFAATPPPPPPPPPVAASAPAPIAAEATYAAPEPARPVEQPQWSPAPAPEPVSAHVPPPLVEAAQPVPAPAFPPEPAAMVAPPPPPVIEAGPVPLAAPMPTAEPGSEPLPIKRGWLDWSRGDDLSRLRGVDDDLAGRLKAEKVDSFSELAGLSDEEEIALERRLDLPAGYLMKEQLREQARLLAHGDGEAHTTRFG